MNACELIDIINFSLTHSYDYEIISASEFNECVEYLNNIKLKKEKLTDEQTKKFTEDKC